MSNLFRLVAIILLCVVIVIPVIIGIYWLVWQLYLWVIQAVWPTGPAAVIHMKFWVFVGLMFLLKLIFAGASSSKG